jgi:hypothetical protein
MQRSTMRATEEGRKEGRKETREKKTVRRRRRHWDIGHSNAPIFYLAFIFHHHLLTSSSSLPCILHHFILSGAGRQNIAAFFINSSMFLSDL